jgi:CRISP-associated protein Cas1
VNRVVTDLAQLPRVADGWTFLYTEKVRIERSEVVRRLYTMRFPEGLAEGLTIEQIRGHEGVRVRDAYARIARETGVGWSGRAYRRDDWGSADPVNRALSAANACLYGVCHAAIVATGFSPGLGFVHVGKQLSFVYDIADLYKVEVTVPAAFRAVREGVDKIESRVRRTCRELFHSSRLLERIVPDIQRVVGLVPEKARLVVHRGEEEAPADVEEGLGEAPGALWNEDGSRTDGGRNYGPAKTPSPAGPSIAKTNPSEEARGDAYEDDAAWPMASSGDDEVPF